MRKLTNEEFINKAIKVHGNKYDYSKSEYKGSGINVCISCKKHGDFWQTPANHNRGHGCPKCKTEKLVSISKDIAKSKRNYKTITCCENGAIYMPANNGKHFIIDKEDFDLVHSYNWNIRKDGYVYNTKVGYLHRLLMNTPKGYMTDHIDHNRLNNRKSNLRICLNSNNLMNMISKTGSSKFKGVCWHKKAKKWVSSIRVNNKHMHLGCFDNEVDAAKAYNEAANKYFKQYAKINLI